MELRRRGNKEGEADGRGEDDDVVVLSAASSSDNGFGARILRALAGLMAFLVGWLRSLIHGKEDQETALHEAEDANGGGESSTLLGYLDQGRIAVHLQRRRKAQELVLSNGNDTPEAAAALRHSSAAYSFLGSIRNPRILRCVSSSPPVTLAYAPLGTIAGFLHSTPLPALSHPALPPHQPTLALPLSWLLQTASALEYLHANKLTHGALTPSRLFLQPDMTIALADFTHSTYNGHNNGRPRESPFAFPINALRYDYFDGEPSANSQALGLAIDVFDFGTLSYKLLLGKEPEWRLPEGDGTWALEELHEALEVRSPELGDEIVVGFVVRDAWCLVFEEGKVLKEDFVHALERHGYSVKGDEVVGVKEAVEESAWLGSYRPAWRFED